MRVVWETEIKLSINDQQSVIPVLITDCIYIWKLTEALNHLFLKLLNYLNLEGFFTVVTKVLIILFQKVSGRWRSCFPSNRDFSHIGINWWSKMGMNTIKIGNVHSSFFLLVSNCSERFNFRTGKDSLRTKWIPFGIWIQQLKHFL